MAHMGNETMAKCSAMGSAPVARWRASLANAVVREGAWHGAVAARRATVEWWLGRVGSGWSCGGAGDSGMEAVAAWLGQGKRRDGCG